MQSLGGKTRVLGINPVTGQAEVAPGSEGVMTATPGEKLTDQREQQRIALEKRRVDIAEKTSSPNYVKPLSEMQQYKLNKLKADDKKGADLMDITLDAEIKNIDKLIGEENKRKLHPGLKSAVGPISSRVMTLTGDTANADALIQSLQSKASINSLQTIRGTAGAIGTLTEREWPRLESMKATLQKTQDPTQFVQSLEDYRDELKNLKMRAKQALNTDYSELIGGASGGATSPAPPPGFTPDN
jgi:hypothetical protein